MELPDEQPTGGARADPSAGGVIARKELRLQEYILERQQETQPRQDRLLTCSSFFIVLWDALPPRRRCPCCEDRATALC